ncbi:MAG TPA: porin, partial [Labilithrix sp.]|nr:porin [Labilithrix sp.]
NLDLYLDAQPVKNWRSLVEIRFTNAPHGEVTSLGGLAGKYQRVSTQQIDPNAASAIATMWGGYTVIERAHIDWTGFEYLKVRVGNFFTPFGIWNVDHGTPTLIALQLPGVIQLRQMPLRQTGVQVYGSAFKGDWELGYTATVSNGRQELSNFAFDDNRGFGGRVFANNEKGEAMIKLGASFYTGRVRDQEVDVTSITPLTLERKTNFDYREIVGGLDASVDVGRTRIRAEATVASVRYDDGKHEVTLSASPVPQYMPSYVEATAFALVAHTLPWVPVELYGTSDIGHGPVLGVGDTIVVPSVGMNIRFTKATMLKTQVSRSMFFDSRGRSGRHEMAENNSTMLFSRLVLVF